MPTRLFIDVSLPCSDCGDLFVFTAGEQELQSLRGLAEPPPEHCSRCRRERFSAEGRPQTGYAPTMQVPTGAL